MPRPKGAKNKPKEVITIAEQITKAEAHITEIEEQLKAAKTELKELRKAKKEEEQAKVMEAIEASGKSLEEVLEMLNTNQSE